MAELWRKKPIVIEAMQYRGGMESRDRIVKWSGGDVLGAGHTLLIPTLEGEMCAVVGDWIIKGIAGEFYPCKPDIFEATYEREEAPDGR